MMADNGGSGELTPKQETFIAALLAGHTIQVSAKAAGIGERTAQRWHKQPHIQAAYKASQRQLFEQALTGLMLKVDKAIETLDGAMENGETYSVRVRASQIVLEQAVQIHKIDEVEAEVRELRKRLDDAGK